MDEKALMTALRKKRIAGAGLDVFEREPYVSRELKKMKQVILLPHIGSGSGETRVRMGFMVLENLTAFFSGKKPSNLIQ